LYHVDPSAVRKVYLELGRRFQEVVLQPQIRSILREVTAEHEAKALYSAGGRLEMSQQVKRLVCCFRMKNSEVQITLTHIS